MKSRITSLFVFLSLSLCFSLSANNGIPEIYKAPPSFDFLNTDNFVSRNILFADYEEQLLFVDFDVVEEDIVKLNILRKGQLMMEDDVTDLPGNTIYEINMEVIRKGTYTIELVTIDGLKIHKNIVIK